MRDELPELETIVNLSHDGVVEQVFHGGSVDLAADVGGLHPRHPRHGDLHLGHHRAAQGRDAVPLQRRVDGRGLPPPPRRGAGRVPRHLLPPDGAHRRAHVHPLPRGDGRLRGHHLPRRRPDRRLRARGPPADHVRRAARVGEDLRRRAGGPRRRPDQEGPVRRGGVGRHPDLGAPHARHRHRGGRGHLQVPRRGRLRGRARARRARRGRVRHQRRGADPGRADQLVPGHRRAAVGDLRHVGEHGPDDVGADPREGRHRRRGLPRHRLLPGRRRRGVHPGRQRVPRLPRRPREDRRGPRRRRHAALRRHRASSTTRATCGSSTARRSSSSRPAARTSAPPTSRPSSR